MISDPTSPGVRVGDRERAAVADRLAAHAAAGRLTVDELEQRAERANAAVHAHELRALLADLPEARRRTPPRLPAFAAVAAAAVFLTVALSLAAGHPVPPVFLLVLLFWRLRWRLS